MNEVNDASAADLQCCLFFDSAPASINRIACLTSQHVNIMLSTTQVITSSVITQHQLIECVTFKANQLDLLSTHNTTRTEL